MPQIAAPANVPPTVNRQNRGLSTAPMIAYANNKTMTGIKKDMIVNPAP